MLSTADVRDIRLEISIGRSEEFSSDAALQEVKCDHCFYSIWMNLAEVVGIAAESHVR